MTDYQFKKYEALRAENEELRRKCEALTDELERLRNEAMPAIQQGMTDFRCYSGIFTHRQKSGKNKPWMSEIK